MKLTKVGIKNFRSIEMAYINFAANQAQVLVGINESGKSNALKAMSFLSPDVAVNPLDIRVERRGEAPIQSAYVFFQFQLDENEFQKLFEDVSQKFAAAELSEPMFQNGDALLTLKDYCRIRSAQAMYWVDIKTGTKSADGFPAVADFSLIEGWKRLKNIIPGPIKKKGVGQFTSVVEGMQFFNSTLYEEEVEFEDIDLKAIDAFIRSGLAKTVDAHLPQCIYWKYEEANILPVQVDIEAFISNPDSCIPLKNCFDLAGYPDAVAALQTARQQTRQSLSNLLGNVGDKTSEYIRSVWKDYKDISIQFLPDGPSILPVVIDKKINFDFQQRSDGFKRFVSFLLLISTKVTTAKIKNTLILIDEPEIGLHPAGARNLMSELIQIAASNYVVYSTHSIFMIDKENIGRHLIVEKTDEITTLSEATVSKITDEEVLYKAIGFSLLEILKPVNILFEGWRDKKLFMVSQKNYLKAGKENPSIAEMHKNISLCHAAGVKDVRNIAPIIELAGRTLRIVSDSDNPAKEQQKKHIAEKLHGEWKTYQDITGSNTYITGEDFLVPQSVQKKLAVLQKKYPQLPDLTIEQLTVQKGRLHAIDLWLTHLANVELQAQVQNEAKSLLFDDLKPADIVEDYQKVLDYIYKKND